MMDDFARLLHEAIGLDPASIGMSSIERAVQQRIAACRVPSPHAYLQHLRATPGELQALIEAVVVPETWFFRDPKAFAAVAERVLHSTSPGRLHFLTVPCSTGEEPYSLAMALLDAGVPPERFQIDALDVSERVLAHARIGIYGRNSFRGRDLEFRDRHFQQTPDGYVLDPRVRQLVHFQRGNLLDETEMAGRRMYDAVFCRNLLIYFDSETQRRAITALVRILATDGHVFVGPAEMGLLLPFDLEPARLSLTFAFRKGKTQPTQPPPRPMVQKRAVIPFVPPKTNPAAKPLAMPTPQPSASPKPDLSEAMRLADEGRLSEVAAICHAALQQGGASADAFYLLAVVSDAAGCADEAATHYRKALYLDPQHHDALLHYSLLTAKRGDARAAQALRERARRCTQKAA